MVYERRERDIGRTILYRELRGPSEVRGDQNDVGESAM